MSRPPSSRVRHHADAGKRTDVFIVGNSKSGTSALHAFLDQHPEICMSSPKEPNMFATDFCHDQDVGAFQRKSESEYLSFFDDCTGRTLWGESSACYLYSKEAAQNIHAFNSDAKIIAIFREPVSFLHSYHLQQLQNPVSEGETVKEFEAALQLEERRKRGLDLPKGCLIPELLYYTERVRYAEHLERFYKLFGRDQVLVLIYEDFKRDNEGIYREVLDFLGVSQDYRPSFKAYNKGKKLKSKTAQTFFHRLTHGEGMWARPHSILKALVPTSLRRFVLHLAYETLVFEPKDEISPALRTSLMQSFRPEVERFSVLVGRDLTAEWGYDAVAPRDQERPRSSPTRLPKESAREPVASS